MVWNAVYRGTANPVIDYYGDGTLNIGSGGWVQNTSTPNSYTAIRANGLSLVVSGGTVQSGRGRAIEGAGPNTVISVTGGTVFNEATSNLFPVIDMTNASNLGVNVTVSGSANVFASSTAAGAYGYVIQSYGNIAISGGTLSTSGTYGRVINLVGSNSNVTVSGGVVQATGTSGVAISTSTTAPTQVTNTSVTITGGLVASYATGSGWAIHTTGSNSTVSISGGTVFAYGSSITGSSNSVIYTERNAVGFTIPTGNGLAIAWNRTAWLTGGQGVYFTSTQDQILTSPAVAPAQVSWGKRNPAINRPFDGINYNNSGNTGFVQLQEVTVVDANYFVDVTIAQGGGIPGNEVDVVVTINGVTSTPPYSPITNSQRITVPYNQNVSLTVKSASGLQNYFISLVDTWDYNTGSGYFATPLFAGTAIGGEFIYNITNIANNQVFRVQYGQSIPTQRTIIAFAGVGGSFNAPVSNPVSLSSNRSFTVTAQDGYRILGVVVDGQTVPLNTLGNPVGTPTNLLSGSYTFNNIQLNHVITATFERMNVNITATASAGGSISPQGNLTVPYGGDQIFTITPDEGYFIEEVLIDDVPVHTTSVQEFLNVVGNHTISVRFALNAKPDVYDFSIIRNPAAGGTVSGTQSGYYEAGTPISVIALANDGYHFTNWTIDGAEITGGEYAKPATFNMPANTVILTANFEANPPGTFTLNVIGAEGGTLSGTRSGAYAEGYAVSVTAIPDPGFVFTGWTITGMNITGGNNANPAQFLMPGNMVTIIASFREEGSPQTGVNRDIVVPLVMLAVGVILFAGAEFYRRRWKKKPKK